MGQKEEKESPTSTLKRLSPKTKPSPNEESPSAKRNATGTEDTRSPVNKLGSGAKVTEAYSSPSIGNSTMNQQSRMGRSVTIDLDDDSEGETRSPTASEFAEGENFDGSEPLVFDIISAVVDKKGSVTIVSPGGCFKISESTLQLESEFKETVDIQLVMHMSYVDECEMIFLFISLKASDFTKRHENAVDQEMIIRIADTSLFRSRTKFLRRILLAQDVTLTRKTFGKKSFSFLIPKDKEDWNAGDKKEHYELIASPDHELMFSYPPNSSDTVRITNQEYKSLHGSEFILDNVINFMFHYLRRKYTHQGTYTIKNFNTFFYSMNLCDKQKQLSTMTRWGHLADETLFNNAVIAIPVHIELHWILVCVLNPRQKIPGMFSGIVYFDSLEGFVTDPDIVMSNVREFLVRIAVLHDKSSEVANKLPFLVPNTPKQNNYFDCGLFIIHFLKQILVQTQLDASKVDKLFLDSLTPPQNLRPEIQSIMRVKRRKYATRS